MEKIKKIFKVLIVLFAVIGFIASGFIAFDYLQARSAGRGVNFVVSFPLFFKPNIDLHRGLPGQPSI